MLLAVFFIFMFLLACGAIFRRWQNGIVLLLAFLPFAGVVTLLLYPSPYPILIKDFYLVIPAYLAFFIRKNRSSAQGEIPSSIILVLLAFAFMVLLQSFNPELINWMVAAIGAKVWLFYIPLLFLAYTMIESRDDLIRILRLMVAIAWIPCAIGIVQWLSSMIFGYQTTMVAFYGDAADGATQNFARFSIGGLFFRIPSTFTFVTQYFGFTLAMLVPAYALIKLDTSVKWRKFATAVFWLTIVASFMSGARSAFLFVPLFLALLYFLEGKISGAMKMALMLPALFFAAMALAGIDPLKMFNMVFELFVMYSEDIAKKGLLDAISIAPFGTGTGMNTGAARYGVDDPESFIGIENYYAKAVVELGVVGLLVVVAIFVVLFKNGYKSHRRMQDLGLKSCSSAFLAFIVTMALNSFKGWQIDLDPINVYFWIFSGFMLKLPYLLESKEIARKKVENKFTLRYGK
ncbi:MAG: hypothetical protein R8K20_09335 [Gallionellaceae bacterium]